MVGPSPLTQIVLADHEIDPQGDGGNLTRMSARKTAANPCEPFCNSLLCSSAKVDKSVPKPLQGSERAGEEDEAVRGVALPGCPDEL
jgi:hypothetical protein